MPSLKEVLRIIGVHREQEPTPFEQAKKAMKEAGGKELIINFAKELKRSGDTSVIVVESTRALDPPNIYKLSLRWGLKKNEDHLTWSSKETSIVARRTGYTLIEFGYLPDGKRITLANWIKMENVLGYVVGKSLDFPVSRRNMLNLENMSLEDQLRLAMKIANPIPDLRYGEGEQSLKQKTVKSKFSKRIF